MDGERGTKPTWPQRFTPPSSAPCFFSFDVGGWKTKKTSASLLIRPPPASPRRLLECATPPPLASSAFVNSRGCIPRDSRRYFHPRCACTHPTTPTRENNIGCLSFTVARLSPCHSRETRGARANDDSARVRTALVPSEEGRSQRLPVAVRLGLAVFSKN
jgi:hypothetical protein